MRKQIQTHNFTWINVENPTKRDTDFLRKSFHFHPLDLEDCLSPVQTPKIEEYDNYVFIVLRFPVFNKKEKVVYASELDIFINHDFLVTIHRNNLILIDKIFDKCKKDNKFQAEHFGSSPAFLLYKILSELFDYCLPMLNHMGENIDEIEDLIFKAEDKNIVEKISTVRREVTDFHKIIKPERLVIEKLASKSIYHIPAKLRIYFRDLIDDMDKIWDISDSQKETIRDLQETSVNLRSHRLNNIIKVLTIFSVILLPLSLLANIYGMNIALPLTQKTYAFWILMGIMLGVVVGMIGYFRKKKWL